MTVKAGISLPDATHARALCAVAQPRAVRVEDRTVTAPGHTTPSQGDVLIFNPSPLTGERELSLVVSADIYNVAGYRVIAEIETGTRYRATAYATETDYGVVLADRVVWMPVDMLGEHFGRSTAASHQRHLFDCLVICSLRQTRISRRR